MNLRVAEEYEGFGDIPSGLRIYVEYIQQIDAIDKQVTKFEAAILMLDHYVSLLESSVHDAHPCVNS